MFVFFDTEFTDLTKDADLISIGLITDGNQKFYGQLTDFDRNKCSDFVNTNVLPNVGRPNVLQGDNTNGDFYWSTGSKEKVSGNLIMWLKDQLESPDEKIYFVSDVCHYDFVLLLDLLTEGGSAIDLDPVFVPVCEDINPLIAEFLDASAQEAFDYSREEFYRTFIRKGNINDTYKHNALYDAFIIREIYLFLLAEANIAENDDWE